MLTEETTRPKPAPHMPASDATTLARGAGVNILGTCARSIRSVSIIILTRLFGAEVFGLYMLSWTVIDLAAKLGNFGLDKGVMRFLPRFRQDGDTSSIYQTVGRAFALSFLISLVTGIALFITAPLIAEQIFDKPDMTGMLRLLSVGIPCLAVTNIALGVTKAHKIMRYDAYVRGIVEPLFFFSVACGAYFVGWRLIGIAVGQCVALAAGAAASAFIFSRFYSLRQCMAGLRSFKVWSPLIQFSAPVMAYEFVYILMIRLDALMVGYFLSAVQVGIFAVAIEIAVTTKKVRQWFDPIFGPIISELHHLRDLERLEHNFVLVARWILTINIAFFCGVALIGRDLLGLFGPEFGAGFMVTLLLVFSQVVYSSIGSGDTMLIMSGHPYINLVNTVVVLVINFLLNLYLIPRFDMLGAALGTLISFALLTWFRVMELYWLYRIHPFRRPLWKPCVAAFVSLGAAWVFAQGLPDLSVVRMAALPVAFMLCYGTLLKWFGLEVEDIMVWNRFIAKIRRHKPTEPPPASIEA